MAYGTSDRVPVSVADVHVLVSAIGAGVRSARMVGRGRGERGPGRGPPSVRFFPPRSCLGSSSPRSLRDKDFVCSSLGEEKENRRRCSA